MVDNAIDLKFRVIIKTMRVKLQVLDVDYIQNDKPIIRIFGKTERNEPMVAFYHGFLPYFYVDGDFEKIKDSLINKPEILNIEAVEKFPAIGYHETPERVLKITLRSPMEVTKIRDFLTKQPFVNKTYEADILFKYRFMIDNKIHGLDWIEVEGKKTFTQTVKCPVIEIEKLKRLDKTENSEFKYLSFDIECLPTETTRPLDPKKDPIIMISLAFRPEYKGKKNLVLLTKSVNEKNVISFIDEKEMLEKFLEIIDEYDPDIITGYNIEGFDLPYVAERLKFYKLPSTLGRANDKFMSVRKLNVVYQVSVPGRVIVDPYQIIKNDVYLKFKRYDLNTVAQEMLGDYKIDIKYKDMPKYWNGNIEKLKKFVEYSRKDAVLALRIVVEKGLLDKFFELAKISGLLLQDVFGGQSHRVETKLLHEFRERNMIMPTKPTQKAIEQRLKEREEKGLKGATVLEPVKGLHTKGCVLVLDFASLYPNLIRTYNISPDTLILNESIGKKTITSPTGAKFIHSDIYVGVLPKVLATLLETRKNVKKKMKEETNPELKRILDAKQLAIKILANSFYGYAGFPMSRLYLLDVANSITGFGRENLQKTKKLIEEKFPYKVIYGDTDSVFLGTDIKDLDKAKRVGEEVSKYVTENLPGYLVLEFEKIFRTFLILTKKRYAGWSFELTKEGWKDKIEMKGIETVRRDWCDLVSETTNIILELVLKKGDIKGATEYVKNIIEKLRNGEIPLEKLTIVKSITKFLDGYKGMLPHIELAKKLARRHPENPPQIGDRISFVIVAGNAMLSKRAEDPEYVKENNLKIDSEYYINSQLLPAIGRILNAVGVSEDELLGKGRQVSITDIMNGNKRENRKIEINYKKFHILDGWEEFVCEKCKRSYRRLPLTGKCECGGNILISYHGSLSNSCKNTIKIF
ncbi:MAG: ribonuclease H-like domain-containing protein [Candidatus Aenigmarchaeota archaeon]|nr:ribonuclease H-like domain-containing protein [Candidatus Aenigmarchaeota archaeon]